MQNNQRSNNATEREKIILAYSGGLDTSVAIKWLQDNYHYDVVAVVLDVGEGKDLNFIKEKALKIGAIACHVIDVQKQFADEYITSIIKSNALYENTYPLISALSRPLIAEVLVDIAKKEGAVAVAHGCTGKGNDQVRFDVSIKTLNPDLKIIAPVREFPMAREEAIAYAEKHGIPLPIQMDNPFSIDQNLWGRSCECGVLEDPWNESPEAAYEWTSAIQDTPDDFEIMDLEFYQGIPVKLNHQSLSLEQLIIQLNKSAGKHGIGRIDHVENRLIGIKSREVYEAPAATVLINAHKALETLTLPREVMHFKPLLEQRMAHLVYEGMWHSSLREATSAFMNETQKTVNGIVRVKLHKGHAIVIGRQSENSLYQFELATYNPEDQFDHQAAEGFTKLWGLPLQVYSMVNKGHSL